MAVCCRQLSRAWSRYGSCLSSACCVACSGCWVSPVASFTRSVFISAFTLTYLSSSHQDSPLMWNTWAQWQEVSMLSTCSLSFIWSGWSSSAFSATSSSSCAVTLPSAAPSSAWLCSSTCCWGERLLFLSDEWLLSQHQLKLCLPWELHNNETIMHFSQRAAHDGCHQMA